MCVHGGCVRACVRPITRRQIDTLAVLLQVEKKVKHVCVFAHCKSEHASGDVRSACVCGVRSACTCKWRCCLRFWVLRGVNWSSDCCVLVMFCSSGFWLRLSVARFWLVDAVEVHFGVYCFLSCGSGHTLWPLRTWRRRPLPRNARKARRCEWASTPGNRRSEPKQPRCERVNPNPIVLRQTTMRKNVSDK